MSIGMSAASANPAVGAGASLRHADEVSHDHGLEHPHPWAGERAASATPGPVAVNAAAWPTPSCALHDDLHYGIG